ncbi:helix-turn-helix transcriptional regulator [bacterium]|nr:helix-turn-helix transcriptional regulator [bacterium]
MSYENQTVEQLANKLKVAQTEIAHLKRDQHIKSAIEKEKSKIEHALRERIKELNCLYGVTELIEENEEDIDTAMQGIANLLPISWQYPEITTGRVTLKDVHYNAPNFSTSPWRQSAEIYESEEKIGQVEVFYLEEMPDIDEGPFLKEERLLIDAIAIRISSAVERISAKRQLEVERKSLQNANITLKEILTKVKEEQNEIGKVILSNVDKTIMPILHALRSEVYPAQQKYIELVQKNLEDITSPFISKLSGQFMGLTTSEIQISNMIRNGLSTKEIAELRHISDATVNRHRENIRNKLGLKNQKVNLSTFLQTHMSD